MLNHWWLFALTVLFLVVGLVVWPWWRRRLQTSSLQRGRETFRRRREWLEARFLTLAERSGRPRGLRWAQCDFDDDIAFARDRTSGRLRALVGVTIQFEAVEGEGMEDVEAVAHAKAATAVFRLDGPEWETDGRAYFNLNPAQTIEHYHHELETVEEGDGVS